MMFVVAYTLLMQTGIRRLFTAARFRVQELFEVTRHVKARDFTTNRVLFTGNNNLRHYGTAIVSKSSEGDRRWIATHPFCDALPLFLHRYFVQVITYYNGIRWSTFT